MPKKMKEVKGMIHSKNSFFLSNRGGPDEISPVIPTEKKKAKVMAVEKIYSKPSFFLPSRGPDGGKVSTPSSTVTPPPRVSQFVKQRRFLYDKDTGEPYAEWVDNVAVCVTTGEALFRSRKEEFEETVSQCCDFSVPKQRHPNDFSVSTVDMVASGFLSLEDFKLPNGAAVKMVDYERFLENK